MMLYVGANISGTTLTGFGYSTTAVMAMQASLIRPASGSP